MLTRPLVIPSALPPRTKGGHLALALVLSLALGPTACAKSKDLGFLQGKDLEVSADQKAPFDRNAVLETPALTDIDGLDAVLVQKFLHRTPYDRPSFLETYQSNGVRAGDAIANAARTYRINPLVILVEAQVSQGLIGAREYPFPPERVEYVFRCGCLDGGSCLPELAGFDRQVECLARQLRVALDQIDASDATVAGWGKDKTSITLDNLKVTPTTEGTAVVYDHRPRVAQGEGGGTWLFWNLWNAYARSIDYVAPSTGTSGGGWIGDRCGSASSCGFQDATCATNFPGGLCTAPCKGDCPVQTDKAEAFCADFKTNGGFCLAVCNPGASACRDGYTCARLKRFGAPDTTDSKYVCTLP
jgi:hypothetical protein